MNLINQWLEDLGIDDRWRLAILLVIGWIGSWTTASLWLVGALWEDPVREGARWGVAAFGIVFFLVPTLFRGQTTLRGRAAVLGVGLFLVCIVAGIGFFGVHLSLPPSPEPTPKGILGIWITAFGHDTQNQNIALGRELEQLIADQPSLQGRVQVRVSDVVVAGQTEEEQFARARDLAEMWSAGLVVFGDSAGGRLYPRIAIADQEGFFHTKEVRLTLGLRELESIEAPRLDAHRTATLAMLPLGFSFYDQASYSQALEQFERVGGSDDYQFQELPLDHLQFYVGNSALNLAQLEGEPQPYLDKAIDAYGAILRDITSAPTLISVTQGNLGIAHQELAAHREPLVNLDLAISAYEEALLYFTPEAAPVHYATTQNNLGTAYSKLANHREPEANLKRAITALEKALKYYTPEATPLDYAMAQNNLGTAYQGLAAHLESLANLERAIAAFEDALIYRTPEAAPLAYAVSQNNLGNAYQKLAAHRDPLANLERAIAALEKALLYFTLEAAPLYYATTQNNLGNAYWDLADYRDPPANLELAIAAYEEALAHYTPKAVPLHYAGTQINLGIAYEKLAAHRDPLVNLKLAIAAHQEALPHYTPEATPLYYAATQINLGNAYLDLSDRREPVANLELAIAAYEEALKHYTREAVPRRYATTQDNLGTAYRNLAAHRDPLANLELGIAAHEEALKYRTPEAAPLAYAGTQHNLGNAYLDLAAHRDPLANLELAIAAYEEALKHNTPETAPLRYAGTQNNLGIAYRRMAAHRDPLANLERAAAAWAVSLIVFAREGDLRASFPIGLLRHLRSELGPEEFHALLDSVTVQEALSQQDATLEVLSSALSQVD